MKHNYAFIDGANFDKTCKKLGLHVDFEKVIDWLNSCATRRNYFYTAVKEENGHIPLRKQLDWMQFHGFHTVTKLAKVYHSPIVNSTTGESIETWKGNMDIEIAIDMLQLAPIMDCAFLFTGDGDFIPVVEAVQKQGVHVTLISTLQQPILSDDLRRVVDRFVDIVDLNWRSS